MPIPTQYVLNTIITLPSNIIYTDNNGNPVYSLYVWDYVVLLGQNLNNYINSYKSLNSQVQNQASQISVLQSLCSGITTPYVTPEINGLCLNSNTLEAIDTLLEKQIIDWCDLVSVLGGNSALTTAISYQCPSLNSAPSFSTPGTSMSAISGWVPTPTLVADSLTNMWLTICDLRGGMQIVLDALTPTCAQCIIDTMSYLPSYSTGINIYFQGYTFIPAGFIDKGSTMNVTDSAGNQYNQAIDVVTLSTSTTPLNVDLSTSTLLPTSDYTITVNSYVGNATLGITCKKTIIKTLTNTISSCPVINSVASSSSISFTMQPVITSNVSYDVELLNASGTTLQTLTYANPTTIQVGSFSGLSPATTYKVRVITTIIGTSPVTCPTQTLSTSP